MSTNGSQYVQNGWQFWIDRGGTFTDVVARRPGGTLVTLKLLSEDPEHYEDAAIEGMRRLLGCGQNDAFPQDAVGAIKMGTTVATNALLERKGEPTVLVITKGFADALRIGYQNRPDLFAKRIVLPELLYERIVEVDERYTAYGVELGRINEGQVRRDLNTAYSAGIRSVAIVLVHGYRYPDHEAIVGSIARQIGFEQVSLSHEVSPLIKLVGRGDTTVVDAYLSPILRRYVDRVERETLGTRLFFMQSNGGLSDAASFQGKDSILSGPAGGIVGAAGTSRLAGIERIITFDMGGTSTDVAKFDGEFEHTFETQVAGVRMRTPMMQIHTVAAGGGSILRFDGTRYRVGPESAGADPGPTCYRRNGPLCVTDANVMVGKIQARFFPSVFGTDARQPLDVDSVHQGFAALAAEIARESGDTRTAVEVADGFIQIAVENMADAIKQISVRRGYDVTEYTLSCFGGAGGQHACLVADALGVSQVLVHPFAGVLSAYGIGLADQRVMREAAVDEKLSPESVDAISVVLDSLEATAKDELSRQGLAIADIVTGRKAHIRYDGADTTLLVDFGTSKVMKDRFETLHTRQYGFSAPEKDLIVEAVSVEATGGGGRAEDYETWSELGDTEPPEPTTVVNVFVSGRDHEAAVYERGAIRPGMRIDGPAILTERNATTVVEPGWSAEITPHDHLIMKRTVPLPDRVAVGSSADPVMLEIFNSRFMSIAEQMGFVLQNTSYSVNIKERLDFSCALFDAEGQLVANAPHIPSHLGSMNESVETIIRLRRNTVKPGDVFMLNAPYNGGTHLPDITVVTPVFDAAEDRILFYVASRGHHADVGGTTPGSMPPDSRHIDEEGVLIDNFHLVESGRFQKRRVEELFASAPYPARNVQHNIADLKAQIAANEKGAQELGALISHYGLDVIQAYMGHVQDNAEELVRRVIDVLRDGEFEYEMDFGAKIHVAVRVDRSTRSAIIDFTGTSAQQDNNFNAPSSVCMASVLYVIRTLIDDKIPLNQGCLKPLDVVIPPGCMLSPVYPAAVVSGNVETAQAIVDTLFGALGGIAASQGTMNNFTFGDDVHQYYETICGGAGAGPDFDGPSAIHTHMTNTRLTDPEILERRFPVLLESFSINKGTGGRGRHHGGDGVVRRVRFLQPMTAAILSGHRRIPPYGVDGGEPGRVGRNFVERTDGSIKTLSGTDKVEMDRGTSS